MAEQALNIELPPIPAKCYFTIGEVSELCGVKPHVLRYWEQEFTQLSPVKRRGNRRYYQHHEVLLIRRIRALLYDDRFTISGARNLLDAKGRLKSDKKKAPEGETGEALNNVPLSQDSSVDVQVLHNELAEISAILKVD
jgi:DNA-binding transcriptional MerR regulator